MKHKKLLVAIGVVVALAVAIFATGAAFGWWTTDAAPIAGNSVGTGTATLVAGGGPINVTNLVPQVAPPADLTGSALDSTYPSVSYIYVQNTGNVPLMFYGYLGSPSGDGALLPYVHIRIWVNPATNNSGWTDTFQTSGHYQVFDGTIDELWNSAAHGQWYLGSTSGFNGSGVETPIQPGQLGVYKVACWLDSGAGNDTQGKSLSFSINFHGEQQNEFDLTSPGSWSN